LKPCLYAALLSAFVVAFAQAADAQTPVPAADQQQRQGRGARLVRFLAGGATGLIVHEAGHVAASMAFDADPGFKRLDYGPIPFFAVTHDTVSRRREYVISSAGFFAQHVANEWLLGADPPLRGSSAAFKKGWLTFNLATSAVYTVAALGRFGAAERDTKGMALTADGDGLPEPVIGVLILVPAVLDGLRYVQDDPAWARWFSRAVKASLVLLAVK
jgi:hypothetical protein